ncbi:hypothetical protein HZB07_02555 [Candidatus Saganbacteria bacterium]|nr:hypothetical protein [Candidatus Saganbacteria bacterium]
MAREFGFHDLAVELKAGEFNNASPALPDFSQTDQIISEAKALLVKRNNSLAADLLQKKIKEIAGSDNDDKFDLLRKLIEYAVSIEQEKGQFDRFYILLNLIKEEILSNPIKSAERFELIGLQSLQIVSSSDFLGKGTAMRQARADFFNNDEQEFIRSVRKYAAISALVKIGELRTAMILLLGATNNDPLCAARGLTSVAFQLTCLRATN